MKAALLAVALALVVGPIVGLLVAGCAANEPTPAQQADLAKDKLDQVWCTTHYEAGAGKAAVEAEIDKCRAAVKARRDGGAS